MSDIVRDTPASEPVIVNKDIGVPVETLGSEISAFDFGKVMTVSFGHAIHDTYSGFLAPLLPLLMEKLAITNTQIGLLLLFMRWPSLLQPLIGHLADRYGARYFIIFTPALTAAMMSLLGVAPNYTALAVMLGIVGLSAASLHAVGPAIIGRVAGGNMGRGTGMWMVGGELGRTIAPIAVVAAVSLLTLEGMGVVMVIGIAATLVLLVQFKDVPVAVRETGEKEKVDWPALLRTFAPVMMPIAGITLARATLTLALSSYLPLFLVDRGADLWFAGAALTIFEGAGVAGALGGGWISDRIGRKKTLGFSISVAPVLMLIFINTEGWIQIPLLILLGVVGLSTMPVLIAIVIESFPENRGLANGVYMAITFMISSLAGVAIGALADGFGMQTAFLISALVPLLGLPVLFWLPDSSGQKQSV
jgi:FSR family fosmidomycin resistance protein-like MFS transporter